MYVTFYWIIFLFCESVKLICVATEKCTPPLNLLFIFVLYFIVIIFGVLEEFYCSFHEMKFWMTEYIIPIWHALWHARGESSDLSTLPICSSLCYSHWGH